jgi:hypothetical protein
MRLVCLANSWRPGGRCVAGIDLDSGDWVRPVPKGGSAIPENAVHFGVHVLVPLDVVEFNVAIPKSATRYQRENRLITSSQWAITGKLSSSDVVKYCDSSPSVLHGPHKVVEPSDLDALTPDAWKSLELRHVTHVKYSKDPYKNERWVTTFRTSGRFPKEYSLKLTDPVATGKLQRGISLPSECLLTISLTEPYALPQFNKPELCYKLVAAVIDL